MPLYTANSAIIALPGNITIKANGEMTCYTSSDHLGSAHVIISNQNKILSTVDYDPYGRISGDGLSSCNMNYCFTGNYLWDAATGLYRSPTRIYDPLSRQFLSTDPVRQDYRNYAYAAGNPVLYSDPEGSIVQIEWENGSGAIEKTVYSYQAERTFVEPASIFLNNTITALDMLYSKDAMILNMTKAEPPRVTNVLKDLIMSPTELTIRKYFKSSYLREERILNFNDDEGSKFLKNQSLGGIHENIVLLAPMSGLAHELLHAWNSIYDYEQYLKRRIYTIYDKREFPYFPNEEERYVTLDLESQVQTKIGEPVRSTYRVFSKYRTRNVISSEAMPRPLPPPPPPSFKPPDVFPVPGDLQ